MKILIMVLSCLKPPYDRLEEAQRKTWDSIEVEGVRTVYYYGEDFLMMHKPFKDALIKELDNDWDFLFRTNSSSYVDKNLLVEYLKDTPKENTYIGNRESQCSGAGFIISKDIARVLVPLIPDGLAGDNPNDPTHEDQFIQQELNKLYTIKAGDRVEYNFDTNKVRRCYHYRCKHENRDLTIDSFNNIFSNKCFNE